MSSETSRDEIERFRDGTTFETVAGYCRALRSGSFVYVSGTAALDAKGKAASPGDSYAQTREALTRALSAIEQLGGTVEDVVRTRVFLAVGADWSQAARAHGDVFRGNEPASTLLFVTGFPPEDVLVEVEVDAQLRG